MIRPVWVEVDLDRLAHNVREARRVTPSSAKIMAAVKADGYGCGAVEASRVFLENGADRLATATLGEAIQLRRHGIDAPILVLGYVPTYLFPRLLKNDVSASIYLLDHAKTLSRAALEEGLEAVVHIKVDTGMGRLGFGVDEAVDAIVKIDTLPGLDVEGVFTHFAVSDESDKTYTQGQFEKYMWVIEELSDRGIDIPIKHVSNSAAVIDLPEYSLDMVRPGTMLYGFYPSPYVDNQRVDLLPTMKLKASVSHVKTINPGTGLSYGLTYHSKKKSIIATLPIGYADGYSRGLSNVGEIMISGHRVPIVGRVCMDQCMVDVTTMGDVKVGDTVTLFGDGSDGSPTVEEVAGWLGTIANEVTCWVGRRVPRVYLKDGEVTKVSDNLELA